MLNRIKAIAIKEMRQLKRDKRMLYVLFIFPIFLLVIFGYAINFDVHHIKIVIYDQDKSTDSRNYVNSLTSSDYFDIVGYIHNDKEISTMCCGFSAGYVTEAVFKTNRKSTGID